MRALVTGGAGFIGSNLASALLKADHDIDIIDNLSTGRHENLPQGAKFYEMDIASPVIDKIFERGKYDVIFHLAAQMDVRRSVADPKFDAETNILGGINLLQSAVRHRVGKFVFASTGGAIYGEQDYFPADEKHPLNPVSPYGISKLAFEKYLYFYNLEHGLQYISLRYANVYGPRQNSEGEAGVVAIFCERMLRGEKAVIYGDGLQTRDFVYVGDVVRANMLVLDHDYSGFFNVGMGRETDINTIFEMIKSATGSTQERINEAARPGEQRRSCIDHGKITKHLGWKPQVDLESGIEKTVEYFRSRVS
jgi:UDP-glucose 4-epimerase